jgi:hypothetical protein
LLPPEVRTLVDTPADERPPSWDPEQLEGQLIAYVKTAGGSTPLDPRYPFPNLWWPTQGLKAAWATLLDLTVLRAWGLV